MADEAAAKPFVCIWCGQTFALKVSPLPYRLTLARHWQETGHGPAQAQENGIDRARANFLGASAPPPRRVAETIHLDE